MFVHCGSHFAGVGTLNIAILGNSTLNYCKTFLNYTLFSVFFFSPPINGLFTHRTVMKKALFFFFFQVWTMYIKDHRLWLDFSVFRFSTFRVPLNKLFPVALKHFFFCFPFHSISLVSVKLMDSTFRRGFTIIVLKIHYRRSKKKCNNSSISNSFKFVCFRIPRFSVFFCGI